MKERKTNGWGIASFVCGLTGLLGFITPYIGVILSILAIVFYAKQNKQGPSGLATAGLVLGIIGCLFSLMLLLILGTAFAFIGAL